MTLLLALQDPAAPVPAVVTGIDWPVVIPLIFAGLGILYGQYLNYKKSSENGKKSDVIAEKTEVIADTNVKQDEKLGEIKILVDGRYGEVLQELADVKRLLASESGRQADHDRADMAQVRADDQKARVVAADAVNGPEPPASVAKKIEKIDQTTERIEGKIDADGR